jgi:hypothetical protein
MPDPNIAVPPVAPRKGGNRRSTRRRAERRLNLGKAMVILSWVIVSLAAATTIAAEGPSAVTHIMALIGV